MPSPTVHASERPVVAFVAAFVSLVVVSVTAWQLSPALRDRVDLVASAHGPDRVDFYLANGRGGAVDHHVLYFGLDDEAVRHLRAADVLFLGNSRILFALDPEVFRPAFEARGLKPYVLGFGHREGDEFERAVIERLDLRPRLVVVNCDGFFGAGLSDWAAEVVKDTPFEARKWQWEAEAAHAAGRVVHGLVPNWIELLGRPGFRQRGGFVAHRSRSDGSWLVSHQDASPQGIVATPLDAPLPTQRELDAALAFKAAIESRGARLVLTAVPTPQRWGGSPRRIAEAIGVPLVEADIAGLVTRDGSHLDEESARHWTRAFMDALGPHLP